MISSAATNVLEAEANLQAFNIMSLMATGC